MKYLFLSLFFCAQAMANSIPSQGTVEAVVHDLNRIDFTTVVITGDAAANIYENGLGDAVVSGNYKSGKSISCAKHSETSYECRFLLMSTGEAQADRPVRPLPALSGGN